MKNTTTIELDAGNYAALLKESFAWRYENNQDLWSHENALRMSAEYISRFLPSDVHSKVLDIGIGVGDNIKPLLELGHHVTGLDIVIPHAWDELRRYWGNNIELIHTEFLNWDGPKNIFDMVTDLGCLHHQLPSQYGLYLEKIKYHLKPGAYLCLCVYEEPDKYVETGRMDKTDHNRLAKNFTQKELTILLAGYGFNVKAVEHILRPALKQNYLVLVTETVHYPAEIRT